MWDLEMDTWRERIMCASACCCGMGTSERQRLAAVAIYSVSDDQQVTSSPGLHWRMLNDE
jgi:hypothetical protein